MRADFGHEADFTFETPALPTDTFRVLRLKGREVLSQPFEFTLELVSDDHALNLDALIDEPGILTLHGLEEPRLIHGVIEQAEHLRVGRHQSHYRLRLIPTLAILKHTANLRIFQDKTTREIVEDVLRTAGFDIGLLSWSLIAQYQARDYCVQYRESDWDFISRLLEEEGIFYYFLHSEDQDKLILGDHPDAHRTLPNASTLPFRDEARVSSLQEEGVYELSAIAGMASGKSTLRDYRFKHPTLDLSTSRSGKRFTERETYDYPGEYVTPELGKRLVKSRLEAQQVARSRYQGLSTSRHLQPGYRFTLEYHPREDCNTRLVLRSVEHSATQPQALLEETGAGQVENTTYEARFECFRSDIPFRPPRATARPQVGGLQPALVVGPLGQEIYCDEFGRVKVHFYWDREGQLDDNSSCWVRVSHPWAGTGFGIVNLPRIGQEVLVQFLEGDPDRPVIVGRMYNADNPHPYSLPDDKTKSTWKSNTSPGGNGSNELRFEDKADAEEVYLHAQKDMNVVVEHDHSRTVKRHETVTIGHKKDQCGEPCHHCGGTGNQTISVGGNRSISVDKNQTVTIEGSHNITVNGKQASGGVTGGSLNITGDYKLDASNTIDIQAPTHIKLTCGGSSILMEPGKITLTAGGAASMVLDANAFTTSAAGSTVLLDGNACMASSGNSVVLLDANALMASSGGSATLLDANATMTSSGQSVVKLDANATVASSGQSSLVLDSGATLTGTAKADVTAPMTAISGQAKASLTGGTGSVTADPSGVSVSGPMVKLN